MRRPTAAYELLADWVVACDGASSDTREMVGATFTGQFFEDRFPDRRRGGRRRSRRTRLRGLGTVPERWFWFDPPFHPGQSVLLHKQCDDVWRIDFQLGCDADPEAEKQPERVIPRIRRCWTTRPASSWNGSVYQFACRRIDQFRHRHVIFAGDATAHQVSPFGARANTGVQTATTWRKLAGDRRPGSEAC